MTLAIAIGTLLIGVLASDDELPGLVPEQPTENAASSPAAPDQSTDQSGNPTDRRTDRPRRPGGGATENLPGFRYGTVQPRGAEEQGIDRSQMMPSAPTDPSLRAADSPLASPTQSSGATTPGFGTRASMMPPGGGGAGYGGGSYGSSGRSYAARRNSARGYGLSSSRPSGGLPPNAALMHSEQGVDSLQTDRLQGAAQVVPSPAHKPFTNFVPRSNVSPYLNLFRNPGVGVDNYSTLVRPLVDQNQANQVFGGEIRGLQSAQRTQFNAISRLGKSDATRPNYGQPTNAPEYFMNQSRYYPGFQ